MPTAGPAPVPAPGTPVGRVVRVAVSSPIAVVRAGLVALLDEAGERTRIVPLPQGPGGRVSGREDGEDGPDVVLYDAIGLHDSDGADLDRYLSRTPARVLVLGRDLRPDLASRALARGADGAVPMGIGSAELVEAVEATARGVGRTGLDRAAAQRETRLGRDLGLTSREVEMLALIAQGMSNAEIAAATYLTVSSVKTYVRGAYRRIGVHNRSQAVIWCLQHGFATRSDR